MEAKSFLSEVAYFAAPELLLARLLHATPDPWEIEALHADDDLQLILASRGIGKSTTIALKAAIFAETRHATLQVIVSPAERQSLELFRSVKFARSVFRGAHVITRETMSELELANGSRIICLPAKEETIRGYRCHRVYIDEGARVGDDVYTACLPMLIEGGQLITATTPAGRRGWFWEAWNEGRGRQITARSVDLPRMARIVERDRHLMSSAAFRTEHLLAFAGSGSAFFDYEDVQRARVPGKEVVLYA